MAWWKGDDRSHTNAKLLAAGLDGTGLYFRAVSWCASHDSDGKLPAIVVPTLAPGLTEKQLDPIIERLTTRVGRKALWRRKGDHYIISGYLDYNPSAADLRKRRAERAAAGKLGGSKSRPHGGSKGEASA